MARLKLLLCAEGVVRDAETRNISVYNILDGIASAGFPLLMQNFHVLAIVERTARDRERLDCLGKIKLGEIDLLSMPIVADFQDKHRSRLIFRVQGFVIPNPGVVSVAFLVGKKLLGTYEFRVEKMGEPAVTTGTS